MSLNSGRSWSSAAVGTGFLLGALLLMVLHWVGGLTVVLGRVIPLWWAAAVLLSAALVLRLVALVRRIRGRDQRWGAMPRWLVTLVTLGASTGVAVSALNDLGATYMVLEPRAPSGCRAVVRETSFLVLGTGQVYEVGVVGIGHRVGSWRVDDGYRPISDGNYELSWGLDDGVLWVQGRPGDPVLGDTLQELSC